MRDNRQRAIAFVGKWEGGYSNHPADPGGKTYRGIIKTVYDAYRRSKGLALRDVRELTETEYQDIMYNQYAVPVHFDLLPSGPDLTALDESVNSGPKQSMRDLQRALRPEYGGKIDGTWGNLTAAAVAEACSTPDKTASVVRDHCEARTNMLRSLRTFSTFGRGWLNRVADLEVTAVRWALDLTAQRANDEAISARTRADTNGQKAGTTATTGAVVEGGNVANDATNTVPMDKWGVIAIGVVVLLATVAGVVVFLRRRAYQKARQAAYSTASQEIANGTPPPLPADAERAPVARKRTTRRVK